MSVAEKYTTLTTEKIPKVYDAGVKSEYDKFWDAFQNNGKRTNYQCAGFYIFNAETFRPKYPIRPKNMQQMFFNSYWETNFYIDDFVEFCKEHNIVFDTSQCNAFNMGLGLMKTKRLGVIDFTAMRTPSSNTNIWYGNSGYLQTIDELISGELTAWDSTAFQSATGLTNMNMTGVVATNNLNLSYCTKLTKESLMSVINCLQDYSEYTGSTKWVCTLGTTNLAKLTDAEKAIATEKGWTLA